MAEIQSLAATGQLAESNTVVQKAVFPGFLLVTTVFATVTIVLLIFYFFKRIKPFLYSTVIFVSLSVLLLIIGEKIPFYAVWIPAVLLVTGLWIVRLAFLLLQSVQNEISKEKQDCEKEYERRLKQADIERKTFDLEEARKLQLSMLPKHLPDVKHLDIAVFIETATEVGGDYYDFLQAEDGSLTLGVGDATGHGTKAGIMVALMKSLFNTASQSFYIPDFFNHCTKMIKRMNFRNLYMAMTLARITGHKMILSASGMPPVLVFRDKSGQLEEIIIKGMPLGAFTGFPYQQKSVNLFPGDTLLFMTDGFPELFNDDFEALEFERVRDCFEQNARKAPQAIIDELLALGEKWRKGRPPDDDITFVVVKVKKV
ncbi:SpoIIE family protein phosphatase [candidate division KSB1 bacterium]|nr:SpoIIE family protein phosphatase [candidate division KSB1 bacterium]